MTDYPRYTTPSYPVVQIVGEPTLSLVIGGTSSGLVYGYSLPHTDK